MLKKNLINFLPICQPRSLKFHAMDTLHRHGYDLSSALSVLVPQGGPVLCRDEMEEWSSSEANLFEDALEKYGKDFNDIRQDFVSMHRKQGWGNNWFDAFWFFFKWFKRLGLVRFFLMLTMTAFIWFDPLEII